MDILTVVVIFLILEAAICGLIGYVCRERRVSSEKEKSLMKTSHHSPPHSPRIAHGADQPKTWSHAIDQQPNRQDNNVQMTYFTSRISSMRDCE